MTFLLDDDTRMLRESAGRLFVDLDAARSLRSRRDAHDLSALGRGAWDGMVELGLPGILVPDDHGGSGLGARAGVQVAEMMGRSLATGPFVASAVMGATALQAGDNDGLRQRLLPEVAAGAMVLALAAEETARHRPDTIKASARPGKGGYVLSGRKLAVIDGNIADAFLVAAREEGAGGLSLFLVGAEAVGLSVASSMAFDGHPLANIILAETFVPATDRIAGPERGAAALDRALDAGRLHLAAEMLGVAQEAFDRTIDYLKTRVQFGRKIGEFQALQHRAAIMLGELEIARSVVMKAAALWDADDSAAPAFVSLTKARVGDIACHVTTEAVQLHGGIGVTDAFDIGLFLKRAKAGSQLLGDGAFHTERYARLRGM